MVENDGYVYCEVRKGMYGLKQAARLAFDRLVDKMAPFGYHPVPHSPGFWTHVSRPTVFTLCVDDFGIKYTTKDDANHLLNAIQSSIDWEGKQYVGLSLNWNYDKRYVDLSMPGYILRPLVRNILFIVGTDQHTEPRFNMLIIRPIFPSLIQKKLFVSKLSLVSFSIMLVL